MPFDWADFFSLAQGMVDSELNGNREAVLRTAISRAYYAAFNVAVGHCKRRGYQFHESGKDHELVRIWLRDLGHMELSHFLYELQRWRAQADYDDGTEWLPALMWLSAQDRAERVLEALG